MKNIDEKILMAEEERVIGQNVLMKTALQLDK